MTRFLLLTHEIVILNRAVARASFITLLEGVKSELAEIHTRLNISDVIHRYLCCNFFCIKGSEVWKKHIDLEFFFHLWWICEYLEVIQVSQ